MAVGPPLRGARGRARRRVRRLSVRRASSSTPSRAGTGSARPQWVGFHNFQLLWSDPIFLNALKNNAIFALSVPIQLVLPLIVAFAIHRRVPGWRFFRATVFLPAVYATVVIGILTATVLQLDGPLNQALGGIGLDGLQQEWLGSAEHLDSADPAGRRVDELRLQRAALPRRHERSSTRRSRRPRGSTEQGWMRILVSVVAPNLRRVLEIVLVVNTITAFAFMFTYVYTITNGGPGTDTYVSEFYIYQQAFTNQNMGYAAAIGVMLVVIVLVIGLFQIRILTREER